MKASPASTTSETALRQIALPNEEKVAQQFMKFKLHGSRELKEAWTAAQSFFWDMCSEDVPAYWLTFTGPSGRGKTALCKIVSKLFNQYLTLLLDENLSGPGVYICRRGGMKNWPAAVTDMLEGDYTGLRQLREDWFVCIDDIAAEYERNRDLSIAKLYDVLNARQGKWTLLTCNMDIENIAEKLDTRIASRLLRDGGLHVNIPRSVKDYNLR